MHVKNHHHHANYHNLNYLIFSLKFIPFRFYIWKIAKTKSLSLVSKKGYPNCEYAFISIIFIMKTNQMFIVCNDFMGVEHCLHVF